MNFAMFMNINDFLGIRPIVGVMQTFHFPKISKFDQIFALVVWRSFFFKMSQLSSSDGICKNQPGAQAARGEETGPAGAGTIFANAEKRDLAEVGGAAQ